jgi:hypothetical protein
VVQTGVKSRGWEKRTAQPSPIQSWKSISPSVVWAVKLGALSPMVRLIVGLLGSFGPIGMKLGRLS